MISNNTDIKSLMKKMDHNPKDFFLFDPKGHYFNSLSIYKALKRALTEKYYGRERKKTKKDWQNINDTDESPKIHSYKGTAFSNCQIPYELFHLNRRTKLTIKQQLARLGYLTLRDGSLEVDGETKPACKNLKTITAEMESMFGQPGKYEKPDYFVPFPVLEGIVSSEAMEKTGIQIHCLDSKVIYPLYGVWAPTTQEYLSLLANYVSQKKSHYSRFNTIVDLGCGTGVLPLVLAEKGGFGSLRHGKIISIDSYPRAIQAAKINTQIFGHASKHSAIETDIVDLYF
jgi:Methyltransferase domain